MAATFPRDFPEIEAGPWLLRQLRAGDASALHAYLTDPAVTEQTSYELRTQREVEQLIQFYGHAFARRSDIRWAITEGPSRPVVGTIGFMAYSERHARAELGYDLARETWGRGVATVAAQRVVQYGFEEMGLNRIEATVMAGNARSERVLEKIGFVREGLLRQYKFARGEFKDYVIFGLLRETWEATGGTEAEEADEADEAVALGGAPEL
jgi:ribosomal-protein-alanine N-acetyltransferase